MAVEQAILDPGLRIDRGTSARIAFIARVDALSNAVGRTVRVFRSEHARLVEISWVTDAGEVTSDDIEHSYPLFVDGRVVGALLIDGLSAGRSLDLDELIAPFLDHIAQALHDSDQPRERQHIPEMALQGL